MTDPVMNQQKVLSKEIQFLAYSGWSPKQIEEKLGFLPYTIHIHHHEDLMIGYLQHIARYDKLPAKISAKKLNMTQEEKVQRKREQVKQSYLKRKAAGTLKKRTKATKKRGRPDSKNQTMSTFKGKERIPVGGMRDTRKSKLKS